MIDNASYRFGSAEFATKQDIARAGMFSKQPNSVLVGFFGNTPIYYSGMGGLLLTAGARSGKLRDILGFNVCRGMCSSTMLILDMKGELAAISRNQEGIDGKEYIYWNPAGLHGLPQHRINPIDYLTVDSPSLVSDTKVYCKNTIVSTGSANAAHFEDRAREIAEGLILTLVETNGIASIPELSRIINLIPCNNEEWLNFAYAMSRSRFPIAVRIEEEIAKSHQNHSNEFQSVLSELFKSYSCYSDPVLLKSLSPPYDFSLAQLCSSDRKYQFYMMPPAEFIDAWAPAIKAMFVSSMIYKSRSPRAPQQSWIIDECAQLGKFDLIIKMFTYGAGIGIRPWAVFQSASQMNALGYNAENIITSSAALRSYFGVRDFETARTISAMIGMETLPYEDRLRDLQMQKAKRQAAYNFLTGNDPISAAMEMAHLNRSMAIPMTQQRWKRMPDEILNMPADKQFIFTDGVPPIHADRKAYYQQGFMQGKFSPNPYHP